jgi:hypothetical protein
MTIDLEAEAAARDEYNAGLDREKNSAMSSTTWSTVAGFATLGAEAIAELPYRFVGGRISVSARASGRIRALG